MHPDYSLVIFRSLHCYRSGLVILARMQDVVVVYNVSLTSTSNTQLRCRSLSDN